MSIQEYKELVQKEDLSNLIKQVTEMTYSERIRLREALEKLNFPYYLRHLYFDFKENQWIRIPIDTPRQ